ncbi:MAG: Hpt domain-containing protein [Proteobacteria bacterium]|nr:Hpt domain-containing protein [Pseudomonadota bacterium]
MTAQLDFTELRKITGGDEMMESELFQVFLDSAQECLSILRETYGQGAENTWRGQAHAFKGISLAVGAVELGTLCKKAQENHLAPPEEKKKMLAAIEKELAEVEHLVKKEMH